jgi:cation:H+ antiporter
MTAVALACLPIFFTAYRIDRWEGFLFLGYYAAYTLYLILDGSRSAVLGAYTAAMLWFVLPLTAVTLLVVSWRALRASKSSPPAVR